MQIKFLIEVKIMKQQIKNTKKDKKPPVSPRQQMKQELDAYNKEHGTNYSCGEYIAYIWPKRHRGESDV